MAQQSDGFGTNARIGGRYRIEGQIGQGGMGAVYAAFDERLSRPVAIKVLLDTHRQDEEVVARFEREATAMAAIRHPGIVQIFDQGREANATFVVMERLEGEPLARLIEREAPLAIARAAGIGEDLADALSAAHSASVIHRDLKPSNVFLARVGSRAPIVKILDFGIAKMTIGAAALTRSHQVFGTLRYMSPEQLKNSKHVGAATDVFALGAILYEMLTGRLPHEARSKLDLTYQILNDTPVPPEQLRASIPSAFAALVLACLAKQAEARPSAEQVGETLRGFRASRPPAAGIVSLPAPIVVTDRPTESRPPVLDDSTLRLGGDLPDTGFGGGQRRDGSSDL